MDRKTLTRRPTAEPLEGRLLLSGSHEGGRPGAGLPPIIRIVSPLADAVVAPGEGRVRDGSPNGSGFALNLEIVTRDDVSVAVKESTISAGDPGIRNVSSLGRPNPEFPGLTVTFDTNLITPDGAIIRRGTNLASLFNVAGTDDTPGPGETIWAGWHVLESIPAGVDEFTIDVAIRDLAGRVSVDRITVEVDDLLGRSAQALTPAPSTFPGPSGVATGGPDVTMIAPRGPSSIALGASALNAANGSLFFIQVSALDRSGAGIAVNETGVGSGANQALGLIFDPAQIGARGPNRSFPGLDVTFDAPLRQPNGNLVPAGQNLAPLFDIVGSEIDALTGRVRVTADWVVGGRLELPAGRDFVTITSKVTDNAGRTTSTSQVVGVSRAVSGQDLTPDSTPAANGRRGASPSFDVALTPLTVAPEPSLGIPTPSRRLRPRSLGRP